MFRAATKLISLTPFGELSSGAELSASGTKDTFFYDLRVEIPGDNLDVVGRAFVVQVL